MLEERTGRGVDVGVERTREGRGCGGERTGEGNGLGKGSGCGREEAWGGEWM